ncbi:MAG: response regulator [Rivularia sp. (in: cyanobacteria)]
MKDKCILLIDDEETIQEVVQVGIEIEAGWDVAIASSGAEGIEVAQAQKPDAILLDIMMPEMDGISTLSQLKANIKTQSIPVILLTAKTQAADKKQFQNVEIMGIITKPFNSMTLASRIAKILQWELE